MLPEPLTRRLRLHRDRFAPVYPPQGNSDHAPMAMLALFGLGRPMAEIADFDYRYHDRLAPLDTAPVPMPNDAGATDPAHGSSYVALLARFDAHIARHGWPDTVRRHLPPLLSGCAKDAFHPLIRLGYGIQFGVASEIAAGLAYWTLVGADPVLERRALENPMAGDTADPLTHWRRYRDDGFTQGRFNARIAQVVAQVPLRPAAVGAGDPWRAITGASLQVFDATHDFFALHMVTASHALRVCAPYAGDAAPAIGSVALASAYLAVGAPAFAPVDRPAVSSLPPPDDTADEHDIKLAFSCADHARVFDDSRYTAVAAAYLDARQATARDR